MIKKKLLLLSFLLICPKYTVVRSIFSTRLEELLKKIFFSGLTTWVGPKSMKKYIYVEERKICKGKPKKSPGSYKQYSFETKFSFCYITYTFKRTSLRSFRFKNSQCVFLLKVRKIYRKCAFKGTCYIKKILYWWGKP